MTSANPLLALLVAVLLAWWFWPTDSKTWICPHGAETLNLAKNKGLRDFYDGKYVGQDSAFGAMTGKLRAFCSHMVSIKEEGDPQGIFVYGPSNTGKSLLTKTLLRHIAHPILELTKPTSLGAWEKNVREVENQLAQIKKKKGTSAARPQEAVVMFDNFEFFFKLKNPELQSQICQRLKDLLDTHTQTFFALVAEKPFEEHVQLLKDFRAKHTLQNFASTKAEHLLDKEYRELVQQKFVQASCPEGLLNRLSMIVFRQFTQTELEKLCKLELSRRETDLNVGDTELCSAVVDSASLKQGHAGVRRSVDSTVRNRKAPPKCEDSKEEQEMRDILDQQRRLEIGEYSRCDETTVSLIKVRVEKCREQAHLIEKVTAKEKELISQLQAAQQTCGCTTLLFPPHYCEGIKDCLQSLHNLCSPNSVKKVDILLGGPFSAGSFQIWSPSAQQRAYHQKELNVQRSNCQCYMESHIQSFICARIDSLKDRLNSLDAQNVWQQWARHILASEFCCGLLALLFCIPFVLLQGAQQETEAPELAAEPVIENEDREREQIHNPTYDPQTDVPFTKALQQQLRIPASSTLASGTGLSDATMEIVFGVRRLTLICKKEHKSRWTLHTVIGAGGSGTVVRAGDKNLQTDVALKMVRPGNGTRFGKDEERRLKRESEAMKRVRHSSIPYLHDAFFDMEKTMYVIVMEYMHGDSLSEVLRSQGGLPQSTVTEISAELVAAVAAMHAKKLIHLDIKPPNMMYTCNEDGAHVLKIIDFGLAQAVVSGNKKANMLTSAMTTMMTETNEKAGTFMFMPPEQLEGKDLSYSADVFAIGVTLYTLASGGRFPHCTDCLSAAGTLLELDSWADTPPAPLDQLDAKIPAPFARIVAKALSLDPADRYWSAAEMLAELEETLIPSTVFVSWRMGECKNEVKKQLQPALEKLGIKVIVVDELPGSDLKRAVEAGMAEAHLFIIMGTETYGKKTSGKIDTWAEMQEIKRSGKPFFLINLNPDSSLMRFQEAEANEHFDLDTVAWHRWAVGTKMDPKLPGDVMQKLKEARQRGQRGQSRIQSGYLEKQSTGLIKRWLKRYFMVSTHYLKYYEDVSDKDDKDKLKGVLNLVTVTRVTLQKDAQGRTHIILKVGDDAGMRLRSDSASTAERWKNALEAAINFNNDLSESNMIDEGENGEEESVAMDDEQAAAAAEEAKEEAEEEEDMAEDKQQQVKEQSGGLALSMVRKSVTDALAEKQKLTADASDQQTEIELLDEPVLLEGQLAKRAGRRVRRWQQRYFAVQGHYLKYANTREAVHGDQLKAAIDLHVLTECSLASNRFLTLKFADSKQLELQAQRADEAREWQQLFQEFVTKADGRRKESMLRSASHFLRKSTLVGFKEEDNAPGARDTSTGGWLLMVRHGESEGNVPENRDDGIYKKVPTRKIKLTAEGQEQADRAGKDTMSVSSSFPAAPPSGLLPGARCRFTCISACRLTSTCRVSFCTCVRSCVWRASKRGIISDGDEDQDQYAGDSMPAISRNDSSSLPAAAAVAAAAAAAAATAATAAAAAVNPTHHPHHPPAGTRTLLSAAPASSRPRTRSALLGRARGS